MGKQILSQILFYSKKGGEISMGSENMEKSVYTDILFIGGGPAGLAAAITAKEYAPDIDVLIVDKVAASKGYAGKGCRTVGLLSFVTQQDDPEEFMKFFLEHNGMYLCDQNALRDMAYTSRLVVEKLEKWGVEVLKDENNKIAVAKWPFPFATGSIHPDFTLAMSKHAKKLGVKFLDRVFVVDLLKDGERACGACGFSVDDGTFYTLTASSVVLSCGSQNYDITPNWPNTGLGIATAYRAGAQMRNPEFGCFSDFARVDSEHGWLYYGCHSGAHTAHDNLYNKDGVNVSQKYRPGLHTSNDPSAFHIWYKETIAGNGPVIADMKEFYESGAGEFFKFHPEGINRYLRQQLIAGYPFETQKFEVAPGFQGELTCIRVDSSMMTTIPCLFAIGDISVHGSARTGAAIHIHGTGILNCLLNAYKAGPVAVVNAKAVKGTGAKANVSTKVIANIKKKTFAPLNKKNGISPRDVIHEIQEIMAPIDYSLLKTESKMKEALSILQDIRKKLPMMTAPDLHELMKCIDAESMAICAEIFYRGSLERKETRGWNYRLDYPEKDNDNFLKWVIVQNVNNEMKVFLEDIPISTYLYRPK
jgi:succinate dehydrogenase/fumarate reductase flavoprotein subunit